MKPISLDLRERIVVALQETSSSLLVAARFRVSASFVRKLRLLSERTGDIAPRKVPGRERAVKGRDELLLVGIVREQPDATLEELREALVERGGPPVSGTTMWRQLNRMGLTLKKKRSVPRNATGRT
jgi:transposase